MTFLFGAHGWPALTPVLVALAGCLLFTMKATRLAPLTRRGLEVAVAALGFWLLIGSAGHTLLDFDRNNRMVFGALTLVLLIVAAASTVWRVAQHGIRALVAAGPLAVLAALASSHAKVAALLALLAVAVALALQRDHLIRSIRRMRARSV